MQVEVFIFYLFSILALFAGMMVVFSKNSVKAALFLILTFFACTGLWILLETEFLAIVLVLVYVGAVMVLFLFVVMMLDLEGTSLKSSLLKQLPIGLLLSGALVYLMSNWVSHDFFKWGSGGLSPRDADYSNIHILGQVLFKDFLYPFELAGVLLLVAIIAAIALTFRGPKSAKRQKPGRQVQVKKQDRIRVISMKSELREENE